MTREMTRHDDQIIAMLLGDAPASPALEAWLRVPVRPLFDGVLQDLQARVAAFFRHVSF